MADVTPFRPPEGEGESADARVLRGFLSSQFAYERVRAIRERLVWVVIGGSLLVWLSAAWPSLFSSSLRAMALGGWAVCLAATLSAGASEWRHYIRRNRFLTELRRPADKKA